MKKTSFLSLDGCRNSLTSHLKTTPVTKCRFTNLCVWLSHSTSKGPIMASLHPLLPRSIINGNQRSVYRLQSKIAQYISHKDMQSLALIFLDQVPFTRERDWGSFLTSLLPSYKRSEGHKVCVSSCQRDEESKVRPWPLGSNRDRRRIGCRKM